MIGLKEISSAMAAMDWIGLQPHLALGTAIWFFALGVVLMLDGSAGIKAARYGALFYIFSAVVNGILMRILHCPSLSPDSFSSRLAGGIRRKSMTAANPTS
jgi:hypothetical protein